MQLARSMCKTMQLFKKGSRDQSQQLKEGKQDR